MPTEPVLTAGVKGVNVRTGPSTDYARVGYLAPGMRAEIVGRGGDWWQILYDGEAAWVFGGIVTAVNTEGVPTVSPPPLPTPVLPTPAAHLDQSFDIHEDHWIDVDFSEQQLTAYKDGAPVRSFLVSTGLPATPTPVGRFRIWIKLRYDDMAGPGYYLEDVPFVMYFHEGYGLHGVTWHANFGHRMSHGCVNLPTEAAAWLFDFAEVGTLVNIHE
jgi:lipoprotein-anchoring transpeptidase ErfK/SrfK